MAATTPDVAEVAKGLIKKHPDASTHSLARMLRQAVPNHFANHEGARCVIRYYRGAHGERMRAKRKLTEPIKAARSKPLTIPEPKSEYDSEWGAVPLRVKRCLVLSDIHLPYHDKPALEVAIKSGQEHGVDSVLLNGDFMDFYTISRWNKNPKMRDFPGEIEMGKEFLHFLRETFKGCQIVWKLGNHEERWESYMWAHPELVGIPQFEIEHWMECEKYRVRIVRDMRPIKISSLDILHGHEYTFAISNPVNPARGLFLRAQVSATMGHLHQTSEHTETNLNGKLTTCWSTGCLCNLHPKYRPLNKWNHGAMVVDTTGDDDFKVFNFRIHKGKIL